MLSEGFWQCLECCLDSESTNLVYGAGISGCVALEELNCWGCEKLTSLGGAKSACWTALTSAV